MPMKRILTLCFTAALLLGAALVVSAGGPMHHPKHGHGHGAITEEHMAMVAETLGLTESQKAAAREIHAEVAAKAESLSAQHHQQMEEVHALLDGDAPDPAEVGRKLIAAHAVHKQMEALHDDAMARFSALLDAGQVEKLKQLKEQHHGRGMHGMHGMHPGHPEPGEEP